MARMVNCILQKYMDMITYPYDIPSWYILLQFTNATSWSKWFLLRRTQILSKDCPNSKVHGANIWPIWGRQNPGRWAPCRPHELCYLGGYWVVKPPAKWTTNILITPQIWKFWNWFCEMKYHHDEWFPRNVVKIVPWYHNLFWNAVDSKLLRPSDTTWRLRS